MTQILSLNDALTKQIVESAIKDTGFNMNSCTAAEHYNDFTDEFGHGQEMWEYKVSLIPKLPDLIPFFVYKNYAIVVTLSDHCYEIGIKDSYGEISEWILTDEGKEKREQHVEFLTSLGFEHLYERCYVLYTNT